MQWTEIKDGKELKNVMTHLVNGEGEKAGAAIKAIEDSYQKEVFDEFVEPTVICNGERTSCKNRRK